MISATIKVEVIAEAQLLAASEALDTVALEEPPKKYKKKHHHCYSSKYRKNWYHNKDRRYQDEKKTKSALAKKTNMTRIHPNIIMINHHPTHPPPSLTMSVKS